jgi:PIN domain nuclease of toxin-antitoxin system
VNLLLHTHVVLWVMSADRSLKAAARRMIDAADVLNVSSVTPWEVAMKAGLGKLAVDLERFDAELARLAFEPMPITWSYVRALRQLPRLHGDRFDRMLIAQSIAEQVHFLAADAALAACSPLVKVV